MVMQEVPNENVVCSLMLELARQLVERPDVVGVAAIVEGETAVIRLTVDPCDVGRIVGIRGQTAKSLRTIISAIGRKHQRRYALDIEEAGQ